MRVLVIFIFFFSLVYTTGCQEKNAAIEPGKPQPLLFETSLGGFMGASYRVELINGSTVIYSYNPNSFTDTPGTVRHKVKVTEDQWMNFRKNLDEARIWAWKEEYRNPEIVDGTQWILRIQYSDIALSSSGSNSYPNELEFTQFKAAVEELIDGQRFR